MSVNSCYICLLKYPILISSFTYTFIKFNCPHTSHPSKKPTIKLDNKRRIFCFVIHTLALILGIVEVILSVLYENLSSNMIISDILETTIMSIMIFNLITVNMRWIEKNYEMNIAVYIAQVQSRFLIFDNVTASNYLSICWILYTFIAAVGQILLFLLKDQSVLTYLKCINKLTFGYLITTYYLRVWVDTGIYLIFMKRLFDQLRRELDAKIINKQQISPRLLSLHKKTAFIMKLKSLRRLYLTILGSFQRTRDEFNGIINMVIVANYILAIWMIALTLLAIQGTHFFHFMDSIIFAIFIVRILALVIHAHISDTMQSMVKDMQSVMFCFPINILTLEEKEEMTSFMDLLCWKEPMNDIQKSNIFGKSSICALLSDIIINSMVLTQLYSFLKQQINST